MSREAPTSTPEPRKSRYSLIVATVILLGLALVVMASFSGGRYSIELAVVSAHPDDYTDRELKLVGKIKEGSTRRVSDADGVALHFVLHDSQGNEVPVVYPRNPPDPYKEGRQCIVEGRLRADGVVDCSRLTVKCPSKYQTEGAESGSDNDDYYRKRYAPGTQAPSGTGPSS